jgi:hypothetical protein
LICPLRTRAMLTWYSSAESELFKNSAGTPAACICSTWSFIRAMSGETTTVSPEKISAGIW